jgi:UDP-N-acetyl-2-amino-2-deoxyglucuronate dehydrogenase
MSKKLRIGVSGIGWCGCEHIKAFQKIPNCEVVWLHGRNTERIKNNLSKYGVSSHNGRITQRFEDLIEDSNLDIISIAGLNSTHTPFAIAAAKAGKHLMVEKPVAREEAELADLEEAVRGAGIKTIVSFELYWNPLFKVARWLIESGRLGNVMFVRSNYHSRVGSSYSGWDWCRTVEESRTMLLNAGCHSVDAVRQFCGAEAQTVSAFHTTGLPQGYEYPTTVHLNIQFADGILGQVSASADVASPYHFGLEIFGTKLSLVNQYIRWPQDSKVDVNELQNECPIPHARFFLEPYSETQSQIRVECILPNSVNVDHHPFADEAVALVKAIREGGDTPITLSDAAKTHRICFAANESATRNGEAISLTTAPKILKSNKQLQTA